MSHRNSGGRGGGDRLASGQRRGSRAPTTQPPVGLSTFGNPQIPKAKERNTTCPSTSYSPPLLDYTGPDRDSLSPPAAAPLPWAQLSPVRLYCLCTCQSMCTWRCAGRDKKQKCVLYTYQNREEGCSNYLNTLGDPPLRRQQITTHLFPMAAYTNTCVPFAYFLCASAIFFRKHQMKLTRLAFRVRCFLFDFL